MTAALLTHQHIVSFAFGEGLVALVAAGSRRGARMTFRHALRDAQKAHPLDLVARLDYIDRHAFAADAAERESWYAAYRVTCGGRP